MSAALDAVRRAHEEKFFKRAQEDEVRAYVAKLKAEGRYENAMRAVGAKLKASAETASALPQIMAHSLRLSASDAARVDKRVVDREFMNKHVLVKNLRYTDGFLMGSRVSLGKNKWAAGTVSTGVEGATIFSVHKAPELMSSAPLRNTNGVESRAARHMVDNRYIAFAGTKLKLMPDPTPARAMAWGGTLAVWGTLGLTFTACKSLGIHSMEDVSTVMKRRLTPYGEAIKERLTPLKSRLAVGVASDDSPHFRDSNFAHGIRRVFA